MLTLAVVCNYVCVEGQGIGGGNFSDFRCMIGKEDFKTYDVQVKTF